MLRYRVFLVKVVDRAKLDRLVAVSMFGSVSSVTWFWWVAADACRVLSLHSFFVRSKTVPSLISISP